MGQLSINLWVYPDSFMKKGIQTYPEMSPRSTYEGAFFVFLEALFDNLETHGPNYLKPL